VARADVYEYADDSRTLDGWFDLDAATTYNEGMRWDGSNMVSVHTSDGAAHEQLIRTAGGRWVLNRWSQWAGAEETYEFVKPEKARKWLLIAEKDGAVREHFGELEEEAGPDVGGRGSLILIRSYPERVDSVTRWVLAMRHGPHDGEIVIVDHFPPAFYFFPRPAPVLFSNEDVLEPTHQIYRYRLESAGRGGVASYIYDGEDCSRAPRSSTPGPACS
jgi:hypothetical protein